MPSTKSLTAILCVETLTTLHGKITASPELSSAAITTYWLAKSFGPASLVYSCLYVCAENLNLYRSLLGRIQISDTNHDLPQPLVHDGHSARVVTHVAPVDVVAILVIDHDEPEIGRA